jgi:hypothetical protein
MRTAMVAVVMARTIASALGIRVIIFVILAASVLAP